MKAECKEPPEDNTAALGALSTPRPRGQGIERSQEPREKEQCAWKAATLLMAKKPADAVHTHRPPWHPTLQTADLEEGAKRSYHHRSEEGEGSLQGKRRREKHGVPGHRDTDVLEGWQERGTQGQARVRCGAPAPLGFRALREV